jgi:hypothetical protein
MNIFKNFKLKSNATYTNPVSYNKRKEVLEGYYRDAKRHYFENYGNNLDPYDTDFNDPIDTVMTDAPSLDAAGNNDANDTNDDMDESEEEEYIVNSAFDDFFADEEICVDWDQVNRSGLCLPEGVEVVDEDESDQEQEEGVLSENNDSTPNSIDEFSDKGIQMNKTTPFTKKGCLIVNTSTDLFF